MPSSFAPLLIALLVGISLGYLIAVVRNQGFKSADPAELRRLSDELAGTKARQVELDRSRNELQSQVERLAGERLALVSDLATARAEVEREAGNAQATIAALAAARAELSDHFRALASDIFDDKLKRFVETNQTSVQALLLPLQDELGTFRKKVEDYYGEEGRQRHSMMSEVKRLAELNSTLQEETLNLTKALKGDSKKQGDWGEMLLEQLLQNAGMLEGTHYEKQVSQKDEDGNRVIPDVVLKLPQKRHFVVDSKVSLTAYSEFAGAADQAARDAALRAHVESVRAHVKGLGDKRYQDLYKDSTLDFVVLFMPVEGALLAALQQDADLFRYAYERNVLLVVPSTMLFVVRTIAHVWEKEEQTKNVQAIAERGGKLYDKFVDFVKELEEVGRALNKAQTSYDIARGRLTGGPGNLVRQAEMLRDMKVKSTKKLSSAILEAAEIEEHDDEEPQPLLEG